MNWSCESICRLAVCGGEQSTLAIGHSQGAASAAKPLIPRVNNQKLSRVLITVLLLTCSECRRLAGVFLLGSSFLIVQIPSTPLGVSAHVIANVKQHLSGIVAYRT